MATAPHRGVACRLLTWRPEQALDDRIRELDRTWDIERALETNASTLVLLLLGLAGWRVGRRHRGWLVPPAIVAGFLLQHGLQGWCPPLPVLRRLGFRSRKELDAELFALNAARGDFGGVRGGSAKPDAEEILAA